MKEGRNKVLQALLEKQGGVTLRALLLGAIALFFFNLNAPAAHADEVHNALRATPIQGLSPCITSASPGSTQIPTTGSAFIDYWSGRDGLNALIPATYGICGQRADSAGALPWFPAVQYVAGDTIRCAEIPNGTISGPSVSTATWRCVVTHTDNSFTTYLWEGSFLNLRTANTATRADYNSDGSVRNSGRELSQQEQTQAEAAAARTESQLATDYSCGVSDILQPWNWFSCGARAVAWIILGFASLLLYLAGVLLNLAVVRTVFEFSSLIGNSEGVLLAWGILRDIGNMLLLFGFIFIGLATILELQTYAAKKALPRLLIFAVLMNFSLFAAEAVIDVSNGLGSAFYTQASVDENCVGTDVAGGSSVGECATRSGIAGQLMTASGISSLYDMGAENPNISTPAYFGLILLATIAAVVLFAGAIMLVVRAVVLTMLMVAAPLGFAALAIPPLQDIGKKWWSNLLSHSFFAPVFLLLILVSLKITEGFADAGARGSLAAAVSNGNSGASGVLLVFALVIGFLIASLMAAKKFGAFGAETALNAAVSVAKSPYTIGRKAAGGVGGFAGRNTIGRGGQFLQTKYQAWAGSPSTSRFGAAARWAVKNNVLAVDDAISGTTEKMQKAKFGGGRSFKESKEQKEKREGEFAHAYELREQMGALASALQGGTDREVQAALQKMSANDIKKTDYLKKGADGIDRLARNLSPEKFEELLKDKELGEDRKERLREYRYSELISDIANASDITPVGDAARRNIRQWSNKDLEILARINPEAFDTLSEATKGDGETAISNDQFESLIKSTNLTNTQRQVLKTTSIGSRLEEEHRTRGVTPRFNGLMDNMSAKQIAKVSPAVLTSVGAMDKLGPAELAALMTEDKLNKTDRQTIANHVRARATAARPGDPLKDYLDPDKNASAAAYWS